MAAGAPELVALLWRINPDAGQAERHLWLTEVLQWIRGDQRNVWIDWVSGAVVRQGLPVKVRKV